MCSLAGSMGTYLSRVPVYSLAGSMGTYLSRVTVCSLAGSMGTYLSRNPVCSLAGSMCTHLSRVPVCSMATPLSESSGGRVSYERGRLLSVCSSLMAQAELHLGRASKFNVVGAWTLLGECLYARGDLQGAATCFNRTLAKVTFLTHISPYNAIPSRI